MATHRQSPIIACSKEVRSVWHVLCSNPPSAYHFELHSSSVLAQRKTDKNNNEKANWYITNTLCRTVPITYKVLRWRVGHVSSTDLCECHQVSFSLSVAEVWRENSSNSSVVIRQNRRSSSKSNLTKNLGETQFPRSLFIAFYKKINSYSSSSLQPQCALMSPIKTSICYLGDPDKEMILREAINSSGPGWGWKKRNLASH